MRRFQLLFVVSAAVLAMNARGATLNLDSVDGVKDTSGNFVGPYQGRLDGVAYALFCADFDHNIKDPDTVTVNVSTLNNLSLTRFGGLAAATSLYEQAFYLSSFLLTASNTDRGNIQDAIWSFFASDAPNQSSTAVKGWETKAASNYQGKDYSNFRILTDAGNQAGGKQELFLSTGTVGPPGLTSTPEPNTWALLLTGVTSLAIARSQRKKG